MPWAETGRISMYYEPKGEGTPAVLLVHELGGDSTSWAQVQDGLSAAGRASYAVDLRGYGRSEKPPGPRELEDYSDDLAGFVTSLRLGRVDVIGTAMGAVIASILAIRNTDLVRRLVLCDGADEVSEDGKRYNLQRAERVRTEGMRPVAELSLKNSFPDPHGAARAAFAPVYLANDPHSFAEASMALTRMKLTPADFARIRAPTLVVTGGKDFIWTPEIGRRLASRIPGSRFHVIEEAGHFPHIQTPQQFLDLTLPFLTDTPSAPAS